jgi:hypothetical protein
MDGRSGSVSGTSPIRRRAHSQGAGDAPNAGLAGQAAPSDFVSEELEQRELVLVRRLDELAATENIDAACAATRASAGKRDRRVVLVAQIEEAPAGRCLHLERRAMCRFENDSGHAKVPSASRER